MNSLFAILLCRRKEQHQASSSVYSLKVSMLILNLYQED